jgi:hypothetical protein
MTRDALEAEQRPDDLPRRPPGDGGRGRLTDPAWMTSAVSIARK